jgi:hypothetical protein
MIKTDESKVKINNKIITNIKKIISWKLFCYLFLLWIRRFLSCVLLFGFSWFVFDMVKIVISTVQTSRIHYKENYHESSQLFNSVYHMK